MKKICILFISLICITSSLRAENIGVPAECEDVMLQAFYWDSYKLTKYGRTQWLDLMEDTAAISGNFDLVWFPPSGWAGDNQSGGVGYYHRQLSRQLSSWGDRVRLYYLMQALHKRGTKCIADIVINHRNNKSNWCDFFEDDFGTYGRFQFTQAHICSGDECFTTSGSTCYNSGDRGAADTGTNDGGCRDMDHSNPYVQEWAKAYTQWMLNEVGYDGFRYDMTLGYSGEYLSMYNEASKPYLSVSEYWESIDKQVKHLKESHYNTMIFDFPLKYVLNKAILQGTYGGLKNPTTSLRGQGYGKYAVTFIDNHDTFERGGAYGSNQFGGENCNLSDASIRAKVLQAYAYILMMPGVPCVFWPHWHVYTSEINRMIAIRKEARIHSESEVSEESGSTYAYTATIHGHKGDVVLRLGKNRDMSVPDGFHMVVNDTDYSIYMEHGMDVPAVKDLSREGKVAKIIEDGRVLIRRGEQVYDLTGRRIE